jgi:spermidine synthase
VTDDVTVTLDRVATDRGELVLRRTGERFEIISNGVFLMDTSDGTSERLLIDAAMDRCPNPHPRLLIGGLGVGLSLNHAVAIGRIAVIDVIEIEPTVIGWHHRFLTELTRASLADRRVSVQAGDVADWLATPGPSYDVICLDTDNGPNWLVFGSNAAIYADSGLDRAYRRLEATGVLALWSASRDWAFEARLRKRFGEIEVLEVPRDRGHPDVIYVAQKQ